MFPYSYFFYERGLQCDVHPGVQENGGHDIEMAHGDASIDEVELPAPGEELPITTTSVLQERRIQERHPSVWDRLGLTEVNQQISDQVTSRSIRSEEESEEALEPVNPNVDRINGRDRWKRNPDRHRNGHIIGPGKVNGSREHSQNGARQGPGRKFDGNGLLLEDALRKVSLEHNHYQNPMYRTRDAVSRKRPGIQLEHKLSQADEEEGADDQLAYTPEVSLVSIVQAGAWSCMHSIGVNLLGLSLHLGAC